jgi:hypothetical protein
VYDKPLLRGRVCVLCLVGIVLTMGIIRCIVLLVAGLLLLTTSVQATTEFFHTYDTSNNDKGWLVIEHSIDNGLVFGARTTAPYAGYDFMLVKTDAVGTELWAKRYGYSSGENLESVIEHSIDNGFLMVGSITGVGAGAEDVLLVKTDSLGVEQWTKTYGGLQGEFPQCVLEHSIDNGIVIAGYTASVGAGGNDWLVVKTNSIGVAQWTKTYGGALSDHLNSVIEHSIDNGLVLAGQSNSYGGGNIVLMKTDTVGVLQWSYRYGTGTCMSVIEHSIDQGFVMAVSTNDPAFSTGDYDLMVVKTNSMGVEQWSKVCVLVSMCKCVMSL